MSVATTSGRERLTEWVYRRRDPRTCEMCGKPACIELHVGRGGNYRSAWVCDDHDRRPDHCLAETRRTE